MALFAPVPMTISQLIFGPWLSTLLTIVVTGIGQAIIMKAGAGSTGIYLLSSMFLVTICALTVSVQMKKNSRPIHIFMKSGAIIFTFLTLTLGGLNEVYKAQGGVSFVLNQSVSQVMNTVRENNKDILEKNTEEARVLQSFLKSQDDLVVEVMNHLPSILFVMSFMMTWISFYSVLRLTKIWRYNLYYPYGTRELLGFKTPEYFVYPLIIGLGLFLAESFGVGKIFGVVGLNMLYMLGVFYLIQGFGIFYDFLTFVKIGGIFKSLTIFFTLTTGYKFLALLGIFDLWFNFRKFLIKKNTDDEGDIL